MTNLEAARQNIHNARNAHFAKVAIPATVAAYVPALENTAFALFELDGRLWETYAACGESMFRDAGTFR